MKLIKNAKIYPIEGEIIECGDILIEGTKIKAIGENLSCEEAEIIDATGLIAMPGMIDAHSHIGGFDIMTGAQDVNEMVKNVTAEIEIADGLDPKSPMFKEALESGITTSGIAPGSGNVIGGMVSAVKSYGATMDEMILKKEIALKAAMGGNPKGVYGSRNQMPMTRMGVAAVLRNYFREVQEYMKKQEEAKDNPFFGKFSPNMGGEVDQFKKFEYHHMFVDVLPTQELVDSYYKKYEEWEKTQETFS